MSPASQGVVEVERYIGSCLISSNRRPGSHKAVVKQQEPSLHGKTRCYGGQNLINTGDQVQYGPGDWTGAPLISMTSPRRCNQRSVSLQPQPQQQPQACEVSTHLPKNPLSRLAIHTQGAPLILAGRFPNRKIHNGVNGIANALCNAAVSSYVYGNGNVLRCPPSRPQRLADHAKKQQASTKSDLCSSKETVAVVAMGANIANIDSLSIASDESSGSNNSENSLPRIIKPRKRRKKDRKPVNNLVAIDVVQQEDQQQEPALAVEHPNLKPYMPVCYEQRFEALPQIRNHRRLPIGRKNVLHGCRAQTPGIQEPTDVKQKQTHRHMEPNDVRQQEQTHRRVEPTDARQKQTHRRMEATDARHEHADRHMEVKVPDDNRLVEIHTVPSRGHRHARQPTNNLPMFLQEYSELAGCRNKEGLGSCQCRYCDPSGVIWDVDQNCYSPFLTSSTGHFPHVPFLARPTSNCHNQSIERLSGSVHEEKDPGPGVVLRRSWSDPTSYFSEDNIGAPSKDVGVIGDRWQGDSGKHRTLWHGDTSGFLANNPGPGANMPSNGFVCQRQKGLEVSTEIITSPNGHRDLEIKFYSPSLNANAPDHEKILFAEVVDDDEEDFSDIWSYHESKLQQDFRTLLQAEE
ncbi:uncharacterized protein LOC128880455 [Hylaeus volcanicus]|uniref:uncharacterized protein LOC128880455 n=1 Tax=Hylaeus volcanicus TaxID=313075 RepID=UPI0023B7B780|nr:uncharacterized protein LOC128880455 [Hylaeus volcanicus]